MILFAFENCFLERLFESLPSQTASSEGGHGQVRQGADTCLKIQAQIPLAQPPGAARRIVCLAG